MVNGLHRITLTRRWLKRHNYEMRVLESVRYYRHRAYKTPYSINNFLDLIYKMWQIITYIIGSIIYYICMLVCSSFGGMKTYTPMYSYSCPYYC